MNQSSQSVGYLRLACSEQQERFGKAFQLIERAIRERAFPAATLAVTYRGELVAQRAFGHFTFDVNSPRVEASTIFDLASLTKVVAATTMAMLLVERGRLDLEAPVADFLPEFGSDEQRWHVNLRMLLAHSSGLPSYVKLFERYHSRQELVAAAAKVPLAAEPGTHAEYSDLGFILLGEILEQVAGEAMDRFCQHHIFDELRMQRTLFCPPLGLRPQIAPTQEGRDFHRSVIQGEVNDENAAAMGGIAGHAGLFSTAYDLALFSECMLAGGAPVLEPETLEMFTRRDESVPGTSRALGWDTPSSPSQSGQYFSTRSFGHLGFTGTSLWIDPERRLSVVLLTNRTWPQRQSEGIKQVRPAVHDAIVEAL